MTMEQGRLRRFAEALIGSLTPGDPDDRLLAILNVTQQEIGAAYVVLGETVAGGVRRRIAHAGHLRERSAERLLGVGRRVMTELARVENEVGPGTPFRPATDGCSGLDVIGYAAVRVPNRQHPAWLLAGRTEGSAPFTPATLEILELAGRAAAVLLETTAQIESLEQLSFTDGLTNIPNYRYLRVALDAELARAARRAETFTVVMVDVDNLKRYNADHGHLAGSELLQEVAGLLRVSIRATDVVAKYGGDEFVLILPRTHPEGGLVLSERIRKKIALELRGRHEERLSCSFGVAAYPIDGTTFETLMSSADRALYGAKRAGRNRVVVTEALGTTGLGPTPSSNGSRAAHRARGGRRGTKRVA